ncbi:prolyl oligopeptidase family serine peptidase [Maribellus comscasis]|uniref:Prolyl oligopeptidase family serine peptidase n=1 Tax=Maribellus comscasis TaxID=2681766 RepID=A0A6I6JMP7_9BACT|nr:prolyl oligopeptidase family serine peptidase [Maribellus comscasis]QGY42338.1 prolyl oligopeptidase family serine peptidase [Maribellus comscasis]
MKYILSKLAILAFVVYLLSACDLVDNGGGDEPADSFLTGYEQVNTFIPLTINLALDQIPGDYPELDYIKEKVQHGVLVYKITYNTSFEGQLKSASGLVCIPTGEGSFPIMSYQNGTNTLNSNAPSENPDYELYLLLEAVASTGFVVVIPDYLGFGESSDMFHPYLDKESSNKSVLDMLRAAQELAENHIDTELSGDLYIAGYSQGGWATLQLQKEIENKYSGEFNLKASACGAGPYDLNYINEYITAQTTYPMPYYLGYMFNSYVNLGDITTPVDEVFKEPYASKILSLYDGSKSGEEINAELTTNISNLLTANYISNFETDEQYASVVSTLEVNSISAWATTTPTLLIHGLADSYVPSKVSTDIYQEFLSLGVSLNQVTWLGLPETDHIGGIVPSGLASVSWFLQLEEEADPSE